jgi:hypothetical protein
MTKQKTVLAASSLAIILIVVYVIISGSSSLWGDIALSPGHHQSVTEKTSASKTVPITALDAETSTRTPYATRPNSAVVSTGSAPTAVDWRLLRLSADMRGILDTLESATDPEMRAVFIRINSVCSSMVARDAAWGALLVSNLRESHPDTPESTTKALLAENLSAQKSLQNLCLPLQEDANKARVDQLLFRVRNEDSVTKRVFGLPTGRSGDALSPPQAEALTLILGDPTRYPFALDALLGKLTELPSNSVFPGLGMDRKRALASEIYSELTGDNDSNSIRAAFACANYLHCSSSSKLSGGKDQNASAFAQQKAAVLDALGRKDWAALGLK